jgi:hypothetical protein
MDLVEAEEAETSKAKAIDQAINHDDIKKEVNSEDEEADYDDDDEDETA